MTVSTTETLLTHLCVSLNDINDAYEFIHDPDATQDEKDWHLDDVIAIHQEIAQLELQSLEDDLESAVSDIHSNETRNSLLLSIQAKIRSLRHSE